MIIRSLYLLLGIILGIAWMVLSKPSYELSQKAFAPLLDTFKSTPSLKEPAEMAEGFNKPRRIFIDDRLIEVPINWNWNYLTSEPAYGDANWLFYGGLEDQDEQFMLGYHWPAILGFRKAGVRHEVSQSKLFKEKRIKLNFFGKDKVIKTDLGNVVIANFFYRHGGSGKFCTAFLSERRSEAKQAPQSFMIEGYLCNKPGYRTSEQQLTCLINSIKIYDKAYWREPDSAKAERQSCNFAPGEKFEKKRQTGTPDQPAQDQKAS